MRFNEETMGEEVLELCADAVYATFAQLTSSEMGLRRFDGDWFGPLSAVFFLLPMGAS